ncbi:efflux RND transporter periplasmic adaptor subunit [Vulcaniibacterium tengchongense]|uniref:Membrane fusion protein (Multidrug efflux system) n=1 Tax=Vulcaniibacterium tengchongense TaxID=1273429 RepID=A0A3N4VF61_9GAMM|nr:efflux RND transporter periplasmic adaptor subunit [Vulcaniibacterium tengchongense]RPE75817.1 membrane fusion protein (multidrug efflux system) [Vulcaniibacterium tengchongense]
MLVNPRSLALTAALALGLAACGGDEQAQGAPPPPEVGVVKVQPQTVPLQKDLVGRLAPFRSADVRARVPGVLQRRVYEEGSDVKAGQVLFLIDPAPLQAEVGQAQAALASARADYANAKANADRARRLAPTNFISRSDLDNALAAERSAAAAVEQAEAALANARINLGYATVRSPIDGRAGKQQVTEGALVGQGTATLLTTVDQIDPLYVNFSLSVTELEQIRRAQAGSGSEGEVRVVLPDGTAYARTGTLDFSGDVVDPTTGAIALRARLPNPDKRLLPGTYVTLKAVLGEQANAFLVPQAALLRDAQGAYVLVVGADGKVARKNVTADRLQGADWVVTAGLAAGDQVIVSGIQRAQPGQPAKPTPWQPQAQPGAPAQGGKPAGQVPQQPAQQDAAKKD